MTFRRPETDRKVFDVSLYQCTVLALEKHLPEGQQGVEILSPSQDAALSSSLHASCTEASPQFVYRYSSAPQEPSTTNLVLHQLNIVVRFQPMIHLGKFFSNLGPDLAKQAAESDVAATAPSEDVPSAPLAQVPGFDSPLPSSPATPVATPSTAGSSERLTPRDKPLSRELSMDSIDERDEDDGLLQVLRRVKIMVHHPRIVFPEDSGENGGNETKAVVIRGLGVGSYVHEVERRRGGLLPKTSWSAELERLECYISHDATLSSRDAERGVSLLNPVSCSLLYTRSYSPLRCPVRSVRLALEDVTIYLSYQDLQTLTHILEGWYRANIGSRSSARLATASTPDAPPEPSSVLPAPRPRGIYELQFANPRLGLTLRKWQGVAVVDSKDVGEGPPYPGDVILTVNGVPVGHGEALSMIRNMPRPLTIAFQPHGEVYSLRVGLEDLYIHRSKLPDCTLVSDKVAREAKPSAILIAIAGRPVESLGYSATLELLQSTRSPMLLHVRETGRPPRVDDVEVEMSGLSVLVIDDSNGRDIPVARARAAGLQSRLRNVVAGDFGKEGRVLSSAARVEVSLDYYNGRIASWEPLLEPVSLTCGLKREAGGTSIDLTAAGALHVNLTDAALERILRTLEDWKQATAPAGSSPVTALVESPNRLPGGEAPSSGPSRKRAAPYVLQNLTGVPARFWVVRQESLSGGAGPEAHGKAAIGAAGGATSHGGSIFEAPAGASVPFTVEQHGPQHHSPLQHHHHHHSLVPDDESSRTRRREYDDVHTLFVRLGGAYPLDVELSSLPMVRVGTYTYPILPGRGRGPGIGGRVTWVVTVEGGRRYLTLRSGVEVENACGVALELRCVDEEDEQASLLVAPWAKVPLPLGWVKREGPVVARPATGAEDYGWSGGFWNAATAYGEGSEVQKAVHCLPLKGQQAGGAARPMVLHLEALAMEGGTYTLRIYAGVTLLNLLPVGARYAWREDAGATPVEVSMLTSGEERGLLRADLGGSSLELCVKLDAYARSSWIRLRAGVEGKISRELELSDEAGGSMVVMMDVEARGPRGLLVTVYVDVWVENLSGLGLVYGEARPGVAVETLGGPVSTDVALAAFQVSERDVLLEC